MHWHRVRVVEVSAAGRAFLIDVGCAGIVAVALIPTVVGVLMLYAATALLHVGGRCLAAASSIDEKGERP